MNILIVTQYFYPENFRVNDLATEFKNRGHEITVLTGIPNYPAGKYYNGYGVVKKNRETYKGMKIFRSPLIPRGSGSSVRLALNYISFIIGSIFTSLILLRKKYDIIFVFEPSPITVCLPAIFIKKIKKIPICFWVLDLWPESVVSAGNLKTGLIPKILNPLVKFIYKHSDKILVSSRGFINSIEEKGINKNKVNFFPQWAEPIFKPLKPERILLSSISTNDFIVMFAGNIGEAQDFPSILEAAKLLREYSNIHWVILGGGRKEKWVRERVDEFNLGSNFHLLGSYPLEKMPEFYSHADCMLFSLKKEYIFSITIPAKVQTYLACAKPVVAMIDGEAAKIIDDSKAGISCPSESPEILSKNIKHLSLMKKNDLNKLGENALAYYNKEFERDMLIDEMEKLFIKMARG
jgi:glycosyltransferase involved in cell wall biosynthesis